MPWSRPRILGMALDQLYLASSVVLKRYQSGGRRCRIQIQCTRNSAGSTERYQLMAFGQKSRLVDCHGCCEPCGRRLQQSQRSMRAVMALLHQFPKPWPSAKAVLTTSRACASGKLPCQAQGQILRTMTVCSMQPSSCSALARRMSNKV